MMVLKIIWVRKVLGMLSSRMDWLRHHTIWLRAIVGVMYFLLFTVLLSSSLFVTKLHLVVGEPSPQLIIAPWNKDIDDVVKYTQDQDAAAKAVQAVYKLDDGYMNQLTTDLEEAFDAVREAAALTEEESIRVTKLQQSQPFTGLAKGILVSLMKTSPDALTAAEQIGSTIILNRARNADTGARTDSDVEPLREAIKADIHKSELQDDAKVFFGAFVDQKVTRPTLTVDEETTEKLRAVARTVMKKDVLHYKANQKIVGAGDIVDESVFQVLVAYGLINSSNTWKSASGIGLIVLIGIGTIWIYLLQYKRDILAVFNRIVLVGLTMVLVLAIGRGVISLNLGGTEFNSLSGALIPVAWATMTIAILIGVDVALLVAVVLAIFVAILVDPTLSTALGLQTGIVALFGGFVGVYSVSHLSQRSDLARAGLFVSAVNVLMVSAIALTTGMRVSVWLVGLLLGTVNGVASSFLTVGALHWFESGFRITSSVRLLELSNPNRPLLKRLLMEAPGTYHHSILVGNLAEAAAEAVHADATLVRVGSMYHDIGKLKRPYFFIENQFTQDNPHDKIAPTLSSLIITSHVKDGLELAKENKLPQQLQDIIAQHHGDGLVSFFYHKALEENEEVPEEAFHYEGPKPQTKEAALVSLADNVEAAVRSMKQHTPGRVEGLVRKIIKDKLNDGQLDQCDLTFQDLDRIAMAFVRVLSGIFHSRVEYPELPAARDGSGTQKKLLEEASKQTSKLSGEAVKVLEDGVASKTEIPQVESSSPVNDES
ncbi:HDIG domain-containing protein [Desulfosporosinus fructosivorans]|uniref:HDIG domain-containing protein n=2 Tax=Desulfosporosinus fructosivorans TaxID=2018669 RepID=A0A4Z0R9P6_9FIRM|nr:HDIG domain-containing metalloprotein [Desulfosporosinus fructosivorans]TGE39872.1 HDIG domain-containing protein [Desulfosporosinus fructosivorans]